MEDRLESFGSHNSDESGRRDRASSPRNTAISSYIKRRRAVIFGRSVKIRIFIRALSPRSLLDPRAKSRGDIEYRIARSISPLSLSYFFFFHFRDTREI